MNFMPALAPPSTRNKGIICKNYFSTKQCSHVNCPYAHIADGDEHPIPQTTCLFYQQSKCLREDCKFFHGQKQDLAKLKASGKATYRPQDWMQVATPPTEAPKPVIIPLMPPQPMQQQQQLQLPPFQQWQYPSQMVSFPPQQQLLAPMPQPIPQQSAAPQLIVSNGQYFLVQPAAFEMQPLQQPMTTFILTA